MIVHFFYRFVVNAEEQNKQTKQLIMTMARNVQQDVREINTNVQYQHF